MRIGIIDIGSNTIRLAVYDSGKKQTIKNDVNYAGLIAYVDKGEISDEGLNVLCDTVSRMNGICKECRCDEISAFATASLRDISDKEALIKKVYERTGVLIEIVSGEREAELDYLGLLSKYDVENGAVFDLGGGSAQIIIFQNGQVKTHISKKIGALRLYKDFVEGIFPTKAEEERIREYVRNEISEISAKGYPFVFAMGGAASSFRKLIKGILNEESDEFTLADLRVFSKLSQKLIESIIPERLYTLKPAIIAVEEICKALKTDKIKATACGVREGMILEMTKKSVSC